MKASHAADTPSCCGAGTPGLLGNLRDAVYGLLGGNCSTGIAPERSLRISSPCNGSLDRIAEPQKQYAASQSWKYVASGEVEKKGPSWHGFCAVCKRPLTIALAEEESSKRSRLVEKEAERYAFVITLWGTSPEYVLGAMVLGWSLRRTGTKHDLVVVHTDDVSADALDLLRRAGWSPHLVEYVKEASALMDPFCKTMRFAKVFTKLRVLELVQYSKILLMDIDLLVRENIDNLFDLDAPMAMVRGPKVGYEHGERVSGRNFFAGYREDGYSWGQSSGINAGVMLLKPDAAVFKQMMSEVTDTRHPEHIQGNGPEQDYLSRYYAGDWKHLSVAYNFQLHHMYFAVSPTNYGVADRLEYLFNPALIKVIHYSSEPKPWARKLEACYADWNDERWLSEILNSFTGYTAWVLKGKEEMRREGERNGLVLGPDGHLHQIDWKRCKSKWQADAWPGQQMPSLQETSSNGETSNTGSDGKDGSSEGSRTTQASAEESGMMSEDGWPLGEAVKVDDKACDAAEKVLQITQDLWFTAYGELAADLGEPDLASTVKAATTGPIIRQSNTTWEWPKKNSGWSREDNAGWWVEGEVVGRFIATCSTIPQVQATLSVGSTVLLTSTSEGVHAGAVDTTGVTRWAQSFSGPDSAAAAAAWAESIEDGAMVMLAVIDTKGEGAVGAVLEALKQGGLSCPSAMPPLPCTVAATVGQKGKDTWYATNAAATLAVATHSALPAKESAVPEKA